VTLNAARALGLKDRGQLVAGQLADLAIWQVDSPGELAYPLGLNPCVAALKRGELMFGGTRLGWQEAKE
jgi:imidazolonepropionase